MGTEERQASCTAPGYTAYCKEDDTSVEVGEGKWESHRLNHKLESRMTKFEDAS